MKKASFAIILIITVSLLTACESKTAKTTPTIKLGMTKQEVIKKMGKPDTQTSRNLTYGKKNIYLVNSKVIGGNYKELQKQVDASESKKEEKQAELKSYAQAFGRKSTSHIKKMSSAYKTIPLDNGDMMYSWKTDDGLLVRVDSDNRVTKVYKYNSSTKDGLGKLLFTGTTIYN